MASLRNVALVLAMLLGLGSVGVGVAQEATPAATPTALAWSACAVGAAGSVHAFPFHSTMPTRTDRLSILR